MDPIQRVFEWVNGARYVQYDKEHKMAFVQDGCCRVNIYDIDILIAVNSFRYPVPPSIPMIQQQIREYLAAL